MIAFKKEGQKGAKYEKNYVSQRLNGVKMSLKSKLIKIMA